MAILKNNWMLLQKQFLQQGHQQPGPQLELLRSGGGTTPAGKAPAAKKK
jgi:hypothetical protein